MGNQTSTRGENSTPSSSYNQSQALSEVEGFRLGSVDNTSEETPASSTFSPPVPVSLPRSPSPALDEGRSRFPYASDVRRQVGDARLILAIIIAQFLFAILLLLLYWNWLLLQSILWPVLWSLLSALALWPIKSHLTILILSTFPIVDNGQDGLLDVALDVIIYPALVLCRIVGTIQGSYAYYAAGPLKPVARYLFSLGPGGRFFARLMEHALVLRPNLLEEAERARERGRVGGSGGARTRSRSYSIDATITSTSGAGGGGVDEAENDTTATSHDADADNTKTAILLSSGEGEEIKEPLESDDAAASENTVSSSTSTSSAAASTSSSSAAAFAVNSAINSSSSSSIAPGSPSPLSLPPLPAATLPPQDASSHAPAVGLKETKENGRVASKATTGVATATAAAVTPGGLSRRSFISPHPWFSSIETTLKSMRKRRSPKGGGAPSSPLAYRSTSLLQPLAPQEGSRQRAAQSHHRIGGMFGSTRLLHQPPSIQGSSNSSSSASASSSSSTSTSSGESVEDYEEDEEDNAWEQHVKQQQQITSPGTQSAASKGFWGLLFVGILIKVIGSTIYHYIIPILILGACIWAVYVVFFCLRNNFIYRHLQCLARYVGSAAVFVNDRFWYADTAMGSPISIVSVAVARALSYAGRGCRSGCSFIVNSSVHFCVSLCLIGALLLVVTFSSMFLVTQVSSEIRTLSLDARSFFTDLGGRIPLESTSQSVLHWVNNNLHNGSDVVERAFAWLETRYPNETVATRNIWDAILAYNATLYNTTNTLQPDTAASISNTSIGSGAFSFQPENVGNCSVAAADQSPENCLALETSIANPACNVSSLGETAYQLCLNATAAALAAANAAGQLWSSSVYPSNGNDLAAASSDGSSNPPLDDTALLFASPSLSPSPSSPPFSFSFSSGVQRSFASLLNSTWLTNPIDTLLNKTIAPLFARVNLSFSSFGLIGQDAPSPSSLYETYILPNLQHIMESLGTIFLATTRFSGLFFDYALSASASVASFLLSFALYLSLLYVLLALEESWLDSLLGLGASPPPTSLSALPALSASSHSASPAGFPESGWGTEDGANGYGGGGGGGGGEAPNSPRTPFFDSGRAGRSRRMINVSSHQAYQSPPPPSLSFALNAKNKFTQTVQQLFYVNFQVCLYHALFTYFVVDLFDLRLRYMVIAASALIAVIPFVPSFLVLIPGTLELLLRWDLMGTWFSALLTGIAILGTYYNVLSFADWYFYQDMQKGHPSALGLAIVAGMAAFGVQGAVIGPLVVSLLVTCFALFSESLLAVYEEAKGERGGEGGEEGRYAPDSSVRYASPRNGK